MLPYQLGRKINMAVTLQGKFLVIKLILRADKSSTQKNHDTAEKSQGLLWFCHSVKISF